MKKLTSLLLITAMLLTLFAPTALAQLDPDRDEQGFGKAPSILITGVDYPEIVGRGETFDVVLSFVNNGVGFAYDLTYFVEFENYQGTNPIGIIDAPKILSLNSGQRQNVNLRMKVADNANLGDYRIFLKIDYKNMDGIPQETSSVSRQIKIDLGKTAPEIIVNNINLTNLGSGRYQADITYQNLGEKTASNLTVNFNGGTNYLATDTSSKKHLGNLAGKRTGVVSFTVEERDTIAERTAELEFSFEDENKQRLTQKIQIYLATGGAIGGTGKTPWVIINKYQLSADQVMAGSRMTLSLLVENTNTRPVKNLKISMGVIRVEDDRVGGTVFSPVNSSNTFFIEEIPGKSILQRDIDLFVDGNAAAKTYIVPLTIVYEDEKGKPLTVEELINIPVVQSSMLEVLSVEVPQEVFAGDMVNITSEFVNVGKVSLTNFRVNIEGEFPKDNALYYVGNLDIGMSDFYQGRIIPQQEGTLEGILVFTYMDSSNEEVRLERPFTINVMPAVPFEPGPEFPGGEKPGGRPGDGLPIGGINWIVVVLGIALIGQGVVIYRMKKSKAKEGFYE